MYFRALKSMEAMIIVLFSTLQGNDGSHLDSGVVIDCNAEYP